MRTFPRAPGLRRTVETQTPKVELVIACEGINTEPEYFHACVNYYGSGLVRFRVLPRHGVPITVVRAAIEEREKLIVAARKSALRGNRLDYCFRVWAVFDKDDHDVHEALEMARLNSIDIAFSNPCFEIWPLLHYENYGAQNDRHTVQRRLSALMARYDHDQGGVIDFDEIKDSFPDAYERAARLNAARAAENCEGGCPSTTAGELVRKIIENGKFNFRAR